MSTYAQETSPVTVRPATAEDIARFAERANTPTLKGWVAEVEGEAVALGGLAMVKGRWFAFLDITEHGRGLLKKNVYVRAAMVRGAVTALREAKRMGLRFVYAEADARLPNAEELLSRLGFDLDPRTDHLYRWSNR